MKKYDVVDDDDDDGGDQGEGGAQEEPTNNFSPTNPIVRTWQPEKIIILDMIYYPTLS